MSAKPEAGIDVPIRVYAQWHAGQRPEPLGNVNGWEWYPCDNGTGAVGTSHILFVGVGSDGEARWQRCGNGFCGPCGTLQATLLEALGAVDALNVKYSLANADVLRTLQSEVVLSARAEMLRIFRNQRLEAEENTPSPAGGGP